jgi:Fe-S-cluster containining protein
MMEEVELGSAAMKHLCRLLPPGGLRDRDRVEREMDDMISPEYEPYFSANAVLHLLAACQRCGRCCREEKRIAVSIEDCRRIARHLGLSQKRFMMEYTLPHELNRAQVGSARMLKKAEGKPCPFLDSILSGCLIHPVKPQVCRAALHLSKMNLLLCEEQKKIGAIPDCPADALLRESLSQFRRKLERTAGARQELEALFTSHKPEVELFRLLLRLKGLEIYFGGEMAARLARRLGLARLPEEEELREGAQLYAGFLSYSCLAL